MADPKTKSQGTQPPPDRGHPMPRRTTSDKSVTLRHHRLAWDMKAAAEAATVRARANSSRRNSSGDSHITMQSDAKKWFDRSNLNPDANYDAGSMDVDPPFFQKETDSSNEETRPERFPYVQNPRQGLLRFPVSHSSSADDYRSVIDDLTIENKRLKEELKRYRQFGPDVMKKDKLFEIKVHGLPKRKKRELEATLRDFAAGLEGSSEATSQRRKQARHGKTAYYSGESMSKHASSSSSQSRPVDSAYASMSTGPSSHAPTSLGRPSSLTRAKPSSDQHVENHIADTPGGLYPHHAVMTDKEKKQIVVRRLEQLFTGETSGKSISRNQSVPDTMETPIITNTGLLAPPFDSEAAREARIQPTDHSQKKGRSRDNLSTSNSNGDQTESGGNGVGDGSGSGSGGRSGNNNKSPTAPPPEQRPTRPRDLDPDRIQVPSENMDYIRHLGLVHPEFLVDKRASRQNVSPDADGWVYLNLLCNLAQLHMINVTPGFIRSAVSEKSAKFQLSGDGRKIRWRGGSEGTKFSSDSSGDNSRKSLSTEDTDGSNESGQRKKQKRTTAPSSGQSKFGPQVSVSSESFHYKPILVHQSSSAETSLEDSSSQPSLAEDSNMGNTGNSKWDFSGSGSSQLKKRRRDGAIIYYSGVPFCTDLSGDPGEVPPAAYLASTATTSNPLPSPLRHEFQRTLSGSSLPIRPLSDNPAIVNKVMANRNESTPGLTTDDDDESSNDEDFEFPWCDNPEAVVLQPFGPPLEPCGLGGVLPDDHFAVIVTTRRTISSAKLSRSRKRSEDTTDTIVGRLASMSTSSPRPARTSPIEIEYLSGRLRRFKPVELPPPAMFFPPFSASSSSDNSETGGLGSSADNYSAPNSESQALISQRANPHQSDNTYPDNEDLSSNDEEDEIDIESPVGTIQRPGIPHRVVSGSTGAIVETGSSAATAGDAESGYNSSMEEASAE